MVRTYKPKTNRCEINEEAMQKAIKEVTENGMSLRKSAEMYGIKTATLQHRVEKSKAEKGNDKFTERKYSSKYTVHQVFNTDQEICLQEYLIKCSKIHYGLTIKQLQILAYDYACVLSKVNIPLSWHTNKLAGKDWVYGFRKRHNDLSLRKPENTSAGRAFAFNRHTLNIFYDNYESLLTKYKFGPEQIYNIDETGISTVLRTPRILAEKSAKQVGQITSGERGQLVTCCAIISATGNTVPPVYIFPRVNYKDYFISGAPEGSLGLATKNGWITRELFVKVLQHLKKHTRCSKEIPILLLFDNHKSHISVAAIDYARENGILFLSLPPHTSHKLQPLDVAVFGPFKSKLCVAFNDWHLRNPGKTITIYDIPTLSKQPYLNAFTNKNITAGFSKPGIWPYNRLAFSDEDFLSSYVTDRDINDNRNSIPSTSDYSERTLNVSNTTYVKPVLSPSNCSEMLLDMSNNPNKQATSPKPTSSEVTHKSCNTDSKYYTRNISEHSDDGDEEVNLDRTQNIVSTSRIVSLDFIQESDKDRFESAINLTPEHVRPFPKAPKRKTIGSKQGKSRIYTDTPEKKLIEENEQKAEAKRRKAELLINKRKKSKSTVNNLCNIKLSKKSDKNLTSDSESESSNMSIYSESELSVGEEEPNVLPPIVAGNLKENDFILVKFAKKNNITHYVAQISSLYSKTEFQVSFLRRKSRLWAFVYPDIVDEASIDISDIILKLPQPILGGTQRTSAIYKFNIDLSSFHVL